MQKYTKILLLLLSFMALACDKEDSGRQLVSSVEVSIRASHGSITRTALGGVTNGKQEVEWSVGDKVSVWAKPVSATASDPYTLDGTPFTFATYNPTYNDADFKATISPAMAEGEYAYYALYPAPAAADVSGTNVIYSLPSQQNGKYNPTLDVMYASTTGNALVDRGSSIVNVPIEWQEPTLAFRHLFHLLRIRIPDGKNNLDFPIKRLDITFPQGVVGEVTIDAVTGVPSWDESATSKTISIVLDDDNLVDANKGYIWVHVLPRELSGDVTFVAYNEAGVNSNPITQPINKVLSSQSITPIALTIPASPLEPLTYVEINETDNNLGENWNTMTFSGRQYVVPFAGTTSQELTVSPNNNNRYVVAISAAPSTLAGQSLAMVYDTPNTYFSDNIALGSSLAEGVYNKVEQQVPYLLEEDFSSITSEQELYGNNDYNGGDEQNHPGASLNQLPGWSAARFWTKSGTMRLNTRYAVTEIILTFKTELYGRLDSTPLSKLKDGKSVNLKVYFDAGKYVHTKSSKNVQSVLLAIASHTNSTNPINGMAEGVYWKGFGTKDYTNTRQAEVVTHETIEVIDNVGDNAFGSTFATYSTSSGVLGVTKSTRLCFYPVSIHDAGGIGNCESNVYLDNIRVSIAN